MQRTINNIPIIMCRKQLFALLRTANNFPLPCVIIVKCEEIDISDIYCNNLQNDMYIEIGMLELQECDKVKLNKTVFIQRVSHEYRVTSMMT